MWLGLSRKIITSVWGRKIAIQVSKLLSQINEALPKRKNKILFYAPESVFLTDNSKALFNYLINKEYYEDYEIICCIPKKDSNKIINIEGVKIVGFYSGILHYLTSTYVFYSFGSMRIKASTSQKVVNLTHGTPLKSLGNLERQNKYGQEFIDDFTYVVATSSYYQNIMSNVYQCELDRIIVQGHARNDYLYQDTKELFEYNEENYNKLILWMPTFRKLEGRYNDLGDQNPESETLLPLLKKYSDLKELNEFLLKSKIFLAIKIHPGSSFKDMKYSNIKVYTNNDLYEMDLEPYEFVKNFDALLTDYSSIFFDYLLLDRPIGFTIDDFELYKKNRGFSVEDPLEIMPGHHIKSINELKKFFLDVVNEWDLYKDERSRVNDLVNLYQDGKNRKRLLNFLGIQKN